MAKSIIKDENNKTTAVRYTNPSGTTSYDYAYDSSKVICKEGGLISINDHNSETTTSYEPSSNAFFTRGAKKSS